VCSGGTGRRSATEQTLINSSSKAEEQEENKERAV
jgi:hypothetical protein